ncbi:MAG: hypothetical protein L3K17_08840 [Thermoplasmata archaeon]|nr:hypothetical protein [Thermoplasmata archaeon]
MAAAASDPESTPDAPGIPHGAGGHGALIGAIVAVAVVLAVVVGLGFANVIPGFHLSVGSSPGSNPGGTTSTYALVFVAEDLPSGVTWSVTLTASGGLESSTNSTLVFHEPSGSYAYLVAAVAGYTVDPASGTVVLNGAGNTVDLAFTASGPAQAMYSVAFSETGLATSTSWSVVLNGTTMTAATSIITFLRPNGSYPYSIAAVGSYLATPPSGNVPVDGASTSVPIEFSSPSNPQYAVAFNETGLPLSTSWSIDFNGTVLSGSATSLIVSASNGSYPYTVGSVTGYQPSPTGGTLPVHGGPAYVNIVFSAGVHSGSNASYPVQFNQSTIPGTAAWSVDLQLGNLTISQLAEGTMMVLNLPNGTYSWSVYTNYLSPSAPVGTVEVASPGSGTFTLSGSGGRSFTIAFTAVEPTSTQYTLAATESGLPTGAQWWVFVFGGNNGTALAGNPIDLSLANGSWVFNYSTNAAGYSSYGYGVAEVLGAASSTVVYFFQATEIVFNFSSAIGVAPQEVLLSQGGVLQDWGYGEFFGNQSFVLPDGAYTWSAAVLGFSLTPSSGSFTASGTTITVVMNAAAVPTFPVTFHVGGYPTSTSQWQPTIWPYGSIGSGFGFTSAVGGTSTAPLSVPNGTYEWTVAGVSSDYFATPASGIVVVHGASTAVYTNFTAAGSLDILVAFVVTQSPFSGGYEGVPAGDAWSVTFDGMTRSSEGSLIYFLVPNGTYVYTVQAPSGWMGLPAAGMVVVSGDPTANAYTASVNIGVAFMMTGLTPAHFAHPPAPAILVRSGTATRRW